MDYGPASAVKRGGTVKALVTGGAGERIGEGMRSDVNYASFLGRFLVKRGWP